MLEHLRLPYSLGLTKMKLSPRPFLSTRPAIRDLEAPTNMASAVVKGLEGACSKALIEPTYMDWAKKRKTSIFPRDAKGIGGAKIDTSLQKC